MAEFPSTDLWSMATGLRVRGHLAGVRSPFSFPAAHRSNHQKGFLTPEGRDMEVPITPIDGSTKKRAQRKKLVQNLLF